MEHSLPTSSSTGRREELTAVPAAGGACAAWTIARHELTDHLLSARFLAIALFTIALVPLAVYVGARDYGQRLEQHDRLAAEQLEVASGPAGQRVSGRDSYWTPENELSVLRGLRAPEPLSVLVRGLDGSQPAYWDFSPAGIVTGPSASVPRRLADVLGQLDLEFLVRVVLGLLAILLAFDAVAGEKEQGTLRAVLSQPIHRSGFLLGKLTGGAITLWIPLAMAFLVALFCGQVLGVEVVARDSLARIALLMATSGVYLLSLYALGLLVSSATISQKTSLVLLLVVWVGVVLAIPPLATLAAQAIAPSRPEYAREAQKQALDEDIRRQSEQALGAIYRDLTGEPEGRLSGARYRENKEEMDRRMAPTLLAYQNEHRRLLSEIDQEAERRAARQSRIADAIMALSPAASFARAAADLAGTGDASAAAWVDAARRQQARLNAALFDDPPVLVIRSGGASISIDNGEQPALADLPAFAAPRRDAAAAVERAFSALAVLLVHTALFVSGAFLLFLRYDVR